MANLGVKGKVVFAGTTNGIPDLEVFVVDFDPVNDEQILNPKSKPELTKPDGSFEISYPVSAYQQWYEGGPDLVVRVCAPGGRQIYESKEFSDVVIPILDIGTIEIHEKNVNGWLVTCATLDPTNGDAVWLTNDNQIETLIDGAKMFTRLTERAKTAKTSINLMNYKFYVGDNVVTSYGPPPFVQPISGTKLIGEQLQEILIQQSKKIPVRVLVWDSDAESLGSLILGVLTSGITSLIAFLLSASLLAIIIAMFVGAIAGVIGTLIVTKIKGDGSTMDQVRGYFGDGKSQVETRGFRSIWSILHARVVVIDGETAMVLGSSITRGYFSDDQHLIHDARHGGSLTHDVNVMITGPAVEHLDRSFAMIWNQAGSIPMQPTIGQKPVQAPDVAAVQVIRTLPGDTFKPEHTHVFGSIPSVPKLAKGKLGIPAGETAILEAYQRAIAQAENFIYIEDQYFTCPEIVHALIHRMNLVPDLQLIMVINVKPDHPDYRKKQIDYIKQLKAKISNSQRIQVFTLWSCAGSQPKMDIMPIEVHSKVGIVDDKWATLGTANLDTASMNQINTVTTQDIDEGFLDSTAAKIFFYGLYPISRPLLSSVLALAGHYAFRHPTQHANPNYSDHPSRFVDLNLVIYNGVDNQAKSDFIVNFRKELWAEHLGLMTTDGSLNNPGSPATGWATKPWIDQEDAKFKATKSQKTHLARILRWQPHLGHKEYLHSRGLDPTLFCIRKKADVFNLKKSEWTPLTLKEKCEK
jgi:phosphatidylserine/phosphatidylglycerophosphate/cardiolipin synthase-like enzyme